MTDSHNALVVPMSEGYVVSCSCGWVGGSHDAPGPAETEARDHEENPASNGNGQSQSSPSEAQVDEWLERR